LTFVFEDQSIKFNVTYRAQQLETVYNDNKQNPMLTKELFMHTQSVILLVKSFSYMLDLQLDNRANTLD